AVQPVAQRVAVARPRATASRVAGADPRVRHRRALARRAPARRRLTAHLSPHQASPIPRSKAAPTRTGPPCPILTEQMFYRVGKKRRDSKSRWVQGGPWASPLTSAGAVLRPSEAARATAAALKSRMTVRKNFRTTGAYRRA